MKQFDIGGKGRKQCPGCEKFVGAVTKECQCGHKFNFNKSVDTQEVVAYDEGGRGRKQCSQCTKFIAVKFPTCTCGSTDFAKKAVSGEVTTYEEGGRGKKQCASCEKYVGNRILVCACGNNNFIRVTPSESEPKEVTFYTEGGAGRKQCAKCEKFLGARYTECPCGSVEFIKKEKIDKEIATYSTGGPGRKQCSNCQQFVGARVSICACGSEIKAPEPKSSSRNHHKKDEVAYERNPYATPPRQYVLGIKLRMVCLTPAGECPIRLKGTDEDTVLEWAQNVISHGIINQVEYTMNALKYWSRQFYSFHTPEGQIIRDVLTDLEPVLYKHVSEIGMDETDLSEELELVGAGEEE